MQQLKILLAAHYLEEGEGRKEILVSKLSCGLTNYLIHCH